MADRPPVDLPVTGGCQCGAVRYQADAPPIRPSLCHCRMCQKAYGNVFGALVSFPADRFRFTAGKPKDYRSSKIAVRGFCATCGTPLTFAYDAEPEQIAVTIGSLDHPEIAPPEVHWGVESWVSWLRMEDGLPRRRTDEDPGFPGGL